ncbi:MAG: hypothetical protein LUQ01_06050 [Methanolinea sp.]|nr:hypothetical protein [Methanolinea sp.]
MLFPDPAGRQLPGLKEGSYKEFHRFFRIESRQHFLALAKRPCTRGFLLHSEKRRMVCGCMGVSIR